MIFDGTNGNPVWHYVITTNCFIINAEKRSATMNSGIESDENLGIQGNNIFSSDRNIVDYSTTDWTIPIQIVIIKKVGRCGTNNTNIQVTVIITINDVNNEDLIRIQDNLFEGKNRNINCSIT